MKFRQATKVMAQMGGVARLEAIRTIKAEILKVSEKGDTSTIENLGDWLISQGWSGKETVEELAQAWDSE